MRRILCLLFTCCLLLTACGGQTPVPAGQPTELPPAESVEAEEGISETAVTFTDDLGREVTVDRPQRVACLIGSFADIWYLAGGVEEIVATANDTWTYFDLPLSEEVVNLGGSKELDLEQLVASEPDFVLASCNTALNVELEPTFAEMGLNTAYFSVSTFEEYLHMLDVCTQITGQTENYQTYGLDVQAQVDAAIARADGSRPSVLYIRASGSSCKVKNSEGSVLGEMLAALDCENIADQEDSLLEQLSLEAILAADPDYIFVVLQSSDPSEAEAVLESTLLSQPAWSTLTAVQEGRYHVMDQTLYNLKPNERWGEAYEKLADILYPAE
ncbi:MAG: ABC transporter substrate-binding protein [Candidatus Onthomonas sp.]